MTDYVSAEQLIAFNRSTGGAVRDLNGVRAAADRPSAGFEGHELYADPWSKAGALLHGIASTQNFTDGNKRTAWVATILFLRINSHDLRALPRITKEAFVLAAATGLLDVDQCAEWLKENRLRGSDRLDYAMLGARLHANDDDGTWSGESCGLAGITVPEFPLALTVPIVFRVKWRRADLERLHAVMVTIHTVDKGVGDVAVLAGGQSRLILNFSPPAQTGHPNHLHGIMPTIVVRPLDIVALRPGKLRVVVRLDGDLLASLPFEITSDLAWGGVLDLGISSGNI